MRMLHLAAGAGDMYCGACAADAALARGLMARGHEVVILPLYTPPRFEGRAPETGRIFLGGINAYLQQLSPAFARLPRFLTRPLDHPRLLRWVSRFAIRTSPADLGPMTVSVLAGAEGRQRAELERLLDFLTDADRPDLVSITNSLLSAIAPPLRERLDVPVICGLQGEDVFLEGMPARYRDRAWELIRSNAEAIDRFVAPCESYARRMAELLGRPPEAVRVLRPALDAAAYRRDDGARPREPFTIGYLSAIVPRKGLLALVAAASRLVHEGRDVRLRVAGRTVDGGYWRQVRARVRSSGLEARFEHLGEIDLGEKVAFLHSCSVFVQPSTAFEPRGMTVLEAMAAGVPVLAPDEGIFPESIALCGGGMTFTPRDVTALAAGLRELMDDPERADALGRAGPDGVTKHHSDRAAADTMLALCKDLLSP